MEQLHVLQILHMLLVDQHLMLVAVVVDLVFLRVILNKRNTVLEMLDGLIPVVAVAAVDLVFHQEQMEDTV
ncbi:MAG: hypothetical protein VX992_07750, partial [Acidobacteriota bacterium]|nr:hypothetical protein [Acidobacteriota bacterium]